MQCILFYWIPAAGCKAIECTLCAAKYTSKKTIDCLILGEPVSYSVIEATKITYKYMSLNVASIGKNKNSSLSILYKDVCTIAYIVYISTRLPHSIQF